MGDGAGTFVVIACVIGVALALFVSSPLYQTLKDGDQISVDGTLLLLNNPPFSQITLPVMVWGIQQPIFHGLSSRTFYLARDGHVIMALSGFNVSDIVHVTGVYRELLDVNQNKIPLIEYTTIELVGNNTE